MSYLEKYLSVIIDRGNSDLAASIKTTAEEVGERYIKSFSFVSNEIGLLFGNIQSGKTAQMFGIMSKAVDYGFFAFVLLTTDNVVLQKQTLERVQEDLTSFCVCGENDAELFRQNNLEKPTVIVLKKNARILKLWANVLLNTGFMKGNALFIVDDEADAASLNTMVNRNLQSSINKYLEAIRNSAGSSIYLQVTGTPQAIFLQTAVSGWQPYFTYYFKPGKSYLGGDFFYPGLQTIPKCIHLIDDIDSPEKEVIAHHLLVSAHLFENGDSVSNCLVHPSVRQVVHSKYATELNRVLAWAKDSFDIEFKQLARQVYSALSKSTLEPFDDLMLSVRRILFDEKVNVIIMNGKHDVDSSMYAKGCNIVIGGNTLGRGLTFSRLHTIYYTRTSKKPQADTMWQHSRMFGYDRDPSLMAVYLDKRLYKLFSDINATNNSIISQIEQGYSNIKVYYPENLKPTRSNVLDQSRVMALSGGTNYYPQYPENADKEKLDKLLASFSETVASYQVSLKLILEILSYIKSSDDFKMDCVGDILEALIAEAPGKQGVLIVRRNRNVTQGTGALLSPNDWKLGEGFRNQTVLTLYQVNGRGWSEPNLWVPNIKFPSGTVYYDVE